MGNRKKKFKSGQGAAYLTRTEAVRKLQLSLKDFRKLCILKGIYPREPFNRRKAQHGDTSIKTLYQKKDIQFLLHEPVMFTMRKITTHGRRVKRAQCLREYREARRLKNSFPEMKLDHIVKERYPTFLSALNDLDDCLTLCFLYGSFPSGFSAISREQPALCRKLSFEFLHAIIAGQWLRKVFVSIKGYYFQAEVKGQTITWIMPHQFSFSPQTTAEVDFKIMSTFVQFYIVLLGSVNFRLYHSLNLYYPPKMCFTDPEGDSDLMDRENSLLERVAALNIPLQRSPGQSQTFDDDEELEIDDFNTDENDDNNDKVSREVEKNRNLRNLFKGLKVFVNREVPREPVVFTLRCFGAEVSWDKTLMLGASFDETDETITHQIVDRPNMDKQYISRYYVQPQWIFDSVNARELLPVERYFLGVKLPPHLSPFVDKNKPGEYIPPEQLVLESGQTDTDPSSLVITKRVKKYRERRKKAGETDNESDAAKSGDENEEADDDDGEEEAESESAKAERLREEKKQKMGVQSGKVAKEDPAEKKKADKQELKLREKMVPRKYRNLYKSITKARAEKSRDKYALMRKRVKIEKQKKREAKEESGDLN